VPVAGLLVCIRRPGATPHSAQDQALLINSIAHPTVFNGEVSEGSRLREFHKTAGNVADYRSGSGAL
jgi:hypothetical protein